MYGVLRRSVARLALARPAASGTAVPPAAPAAIGTKHPSPAARSLHWSAPRRNTINEYGAARVAGTQRTKKYISKRMMDKANEAIAASAAETLPFASGEEFLAKVAQMYAGLFVGLKDMLSVNGDMQFLQSSDGERLEIALGRDRGSFTFTPEVATQRFVLFSPVSATAYRYHYQPTEDRWIADSDGHQFEELFVREIMRGDLKSMPNL